MLLSLIGVQQEKEMDDPAASLYTLVPIDSVGGVQLKVPISAVAVSLLQHCPVILFATHLALVAIPDSGESVKRLKSIKKW